MDCRRTLIRQSRECLDRMIETNQLVLKEIPLGHPDRVICLTNSGISKAYFRACLALMKYYSAQSYSELLQFERGAIHALNT